MAKLNITGARTNGTKSRSKLRRGFVSIALDRVLEGRQMLASMVSDLFSSPSEGTSRPNRVKAKGRLSNVLNSIRNCFVKNQVSEEKRSLRNAFLKMLGLESNRSSGSKAKSYRFDPRGRGLGARFEQLEGRAMMAVLGPGDLALVGYDSSGSPQDNFSIVALRELDAGTTFFVNDNEISAAGGSTFADLNEMEAQFTVKAGQTIAAGTVINLPWGAAAVSVAEYDWTSTSGAGLGNANDELYFYNASLITSTTATSFITFGQLGTSAGNVPSGLALGTNAVDTTGSASRYKIAGATYSGSAVNLSSAISDATTNWESITVGQTNTLTPNLWTFNVNSGATTASSLTSISPLTVNQGAAVTFIGTVVAGSGASTPTGTIQIRNGGAAGTLLASTTTIGGSGINGSFNFDSTSIPPGTYNNVQAFYVAGAGFSNSSSSVFGSTLTVNAVGATTTTGLTGISPLVSAVGGAITFTGTVVAGSGTVTPAGTVEIRNGGAAGTLLATAASIGGSGVNGTYSASSTTIPLGSYNSIQAFFVPSVGFVASNSTVFASALTINAAALSVLNYPTAGLPVTQNFDGLVQVTPAAATGVGPFDLAIATYSSAAAPATGWSFSRSGGSGTNAIFTASAGTATSGSVYSYGADLAPDRALGSQGSGSTIPRFGATIRNTTGGNLDTITITFDGEQWRRGSGAANVLGFEYKPGVAAGTGDINGTGFTADAGLSFTAPVTTGTSVALDGNVAANRTAGITKTISGLTWANGTDLILRWNDVDDTGADDGLSIDNFSFTAQSQFGNGTVAFSSPAFNIAENGTMATVTVNRSGSTVGAVSVAYSTVAGGTAVAGTDYTAVNGTLSWADGDNAAKTFTIPITDNVVLSANKTINLSLSSPTGGVGIVGNTTSVLTIRENEMAAQVLLNEVLVNPSSGNDRPYEFVEVRGTANSTLANYYVVQIDGTVASAGNALFVSELSNATIGSNGLLAVTASTGGQTIPAPTSVVTSTALDVANGTGLSNGAQTNAIIFSTTPITTGMDLDTNNDGTLDLPAGAVLIDAVGWQDNSTTPGTPVGTIYGGVTLAQFTGAVQTGTPDAASRLFDNSNALQAAAWFGGDIVDTGDPTTLTYDSTKATTNLPAGAALSPGLVNSGLSITANTGSTVATEGNTGLTAYTYTISRLGDLSVAVNVTWTVSGTGTNPATASDFESGAFPTGTASFAINESSQQITVNVIGDTTIEADERFMVTLSNPTGGASIAGATATSTITNDDFQVFTPGDILITGINTSDPDQFSFVPLVNLSPNAALTFTDNAFDGTSLLTTEGTLTYTAPATGIVAGTKIVIQQGTTPSVLTGTGTVSSTSGFQLNVGGENLFVYTGLAATPNFVFGLTTGNSFLTTGTTTSGTTYLPSTLTVGTSAVAPLATTGTIANSQYTGTTSGSATDLRTLVTNPANWTNSATAVVLSTANFTLGSTNSAPIINNQTFSIAENSANGSAVGTVVASDPNVGQTLTYAITAGNTAGGFAINATTGAITVANSSVLDFETTPTFALTVQVTDNGSPVLSSSATITINLTDVVELTTLNVTSFTPTNSGFVANFSQSFVGTDLNLYGNAALGVTDVTLVGATTGNIRGSLILNAANNQITFVRTQTGATASSAIGTLSNDTYTVTLRSASNGFRNLTSGLLDGNSDGTAGGDYVTSFTRSVVAGAAGPVVTLSIPDFARGHVQAVNVPATSTGLPLYLSTGLNVSSLQFSVNYDPSLLTITGFTPNATLSGAGVAFTANTGTPGIVSFDITSTTQLSATAGALLLGTFTASVPSTAPYGGKEVLDITNLVVFDNAGLPAERASVDDDAVHVAAYFGDTSGNRAIQSNDGTLVARVNALLDTGFAAYQMADPVIIADISGNNQLQSNDGTLLARFNALITTPQIPAAPAPPTPLPGPAIDPILTIGSTSVASGSTTVTVPVTITVPMTEVAVGGVTSFKLLVGIDNTKLSFVTNTGFSTVSFAAAGFSVTPNQIVTGTTTNIILNVDGGATGITPAINPGQTITLGSLTFTILAGASGSLNLNLLGDFGGTTTSAFDDSFSELLLLDSNGNPAPTNGFDPDNDGVITITGGSGNAAPTALNLSSTSIAENSVANATVGTFATTDPDAANTFTYTLVTGTGADDNTSFNISGNSLRATASLDFETKSSYTVRVRTTDQGGLFFERAFTISVTNVNEVPVFGAANYSFSVAENAATGATVGTVAASDVDASTTLTYSLTGTGASNFAINPATGAITVASGAVLDFEGTSSFSLTASVSDGTLSASVPVAVSLTNVNEAPTIAAQSFSIPENSANGSAVGTVAAADVDAGDTRTFAITAGNTSGAFTINASTGAITVANTTVLDFETTPSFALTVSVTDAGSLSASITVTINLTDVFETVDPIYINEIYLNPQGTDGGYEFVELRGTPGAVIPAGTYLVNVEGDTGTPNPGDVQNIFNLSGLTFGSNGLLLLLQKNPATTPYDVSAAIAAGTTVVQNSGTGAGWGNGATSSLGHTADSGATDLENSSSSFLLIRATTAPMLTDDIDADNNGTPDGTAYPSWTILDSIGLLDNSATAGDFGYAAINFAQSISNAASSTGSVVQLGGEIEYVARVVGSTGSAASDWIAGDAAGATGAFRLTSTAAGLSDPTLRGASINHIGLPNNFTLVAPTDIALSATTIDENVAAGATVGTFTTTDPTVGDTHTYSLVTGTGSTDNAAFTIVGNALNITASPNFEVKSSYAIRVRTTDGLLVTFEKEFTISVNDLNEAPTFGSASYTFSVPENSVAGTVVGTASASDPDAGAVLVYSLTGTGASNFAISSTGEITVASGAVLDFETLTSYSLTVGVSSEGGLSASAPVAIAVTNVNESPVFGAASYSFLVAENSASGTSVGSVSATDPDAATTLVYSLSGTGASNFAIDPSTGAIMVAAGAVLNFEGTASYALTVGVTDGSLSATAPVAISLTNVNESPLFTPDTASFTVAENAANGVVVGTVTAVDPDANDSLNYVISGGNGSTPGAFAINSSTGQITVADTAQMVGQTYTLIVTATDSFGLDDTITVSILVSANIAPTFNAPSYTFSLAENSAAASPVGTVTATDPELATLTYSLSGSSASLFSINPATGAISVAAGAVLDFETTASLSLTANVSDGFLSSSVSVTINLTNVNEAPVFGAANYSFTVVENAATGASVGSLVASDVDASSTLVYSLAGTGASNFVINPATGAITVAAGAVLNFEGTNNFSLTAGVSDGTLSASVPVTVSVLNENEAPVFGAANYSFSVAENAATGAAVGTVAASDVDASSTLVYSLAGTGASNFVINPATGAITVAAGAVLNFEGTNSFSLTASVSDGTLSASVPVTVSLTNVNEAPVFGAANYSFLVAENAATGAAVGTATASDVDASSTLVYSLAGTGSSNFVINPSTGAITVAAGAVLNFEGTSSFSLTASVSDGNLSASVPVTVSLTNVNEAPVFGAASYSFSIAENAATGAAVGTVAASDVDAPSTLIYSLVGTGSSNFVINPSTGAITVAAGSVLNFEGTNSFSLTASVSDGILSASVPVTVSLTNVNEAPVFGAANYSFSVAESAATGAAVGTVAASDVDAPSALTYSLSGSSNFVINPTTGAITVAAGAVLNFEGTNSFSLTASVSDGTLSASVPVTVSLTNVNEAPVFGAASYSFPVVENAVGGTTVGTVGATDPDASTTLNYSLSGTGATNFAISSAGVITVVPGSVLNFETTPSISLTVTASDGSLSATAAVVITLTNVNEAPTDILISDNRVADNATAGTVIGTFSSVDEVGNTHTYSLGGTNASNFILVGNILQVSASYTGNQSSYSIDITSTDNLGLAFNKTIAIVRVAGMNQAPTNIGISSTVVAENTASGVTIATLSATDPNPNNTFTFAFATGAGSTDNASFTIDGTALKLAVSPNFEAKPNYSIRVRVTDQGGLSFDKVLSISVTNVNEAPTDILLLGTVAINAAAGTAIGGLSTVDPDSSNTHTYMLGGTDGNKFVVVGSTLRVGSTVLDGVQSSYSVDVTTTDQGGLTRTKTFAISTLAGANTAPTNITLSSSSVAENTASGTTVGTLSATDANQATGHVFSFVTGAGGIDNTSFTIMNNELKLAVSPNFEAKSSYSIRVRVTDAGGLTFDKIFAVNVANVNEAPTNILLSGTNTIAINALAGAVVGTLSTVDPDAGSGFTYVLSGTDANKFMIVGSSLRVASNLNGLQPSYSLIVTTSDGLLTFAKQFTILSTTAANTAPTNITLSSTSVLQNSLAGTVIGTLVAVDANVGDTFTYTLVSGSGSADNATFAIVGGQLQLASSIPSRAIKSSYAVRVRATDAGGLGFEKVFAIIVL